MVTISGDAQEWQPKYSRTGEVIDEPVPANPYTLGSILEETGGAYLHHLDLPDRLVADLRELQASGLAQDVSLTEPVPISLENLRDLPLNTRISLFISVRYSDEENAALGRPIQDPEFSKGRLS